MNDKTSWVFYYNINALYDIYFWRFLDQSHRVYYYSQLQKDLQNLDDATDELMMAEDDSALIPYPFAKQL